MRYLLSFILFIWYKLLTYSVCTGLLIWWHYHVAYPFYSLCGIHGLSVIIVRCMLFTQLGGRLRLHTNLHSHFCFPWIVIEDIFSHSLEYLSECPTSQKLGQHQLISPEMGEGCNITVCWNHTAKNFGQFTNYILNMLYSLSWKCLCFFLLKHNNLLAYIHVHFSNPKCFSKLLLFNLLFKVQSYIFLHSSVW